MSRIGFIGMGNMGFAFAKGLLTSCPAESIWFSCKTEEKKQSVTADLGIASADNNCVLASSSDIIILAVKPQIYDEVLEEIRDAVKDGAIVISLAPGITISYVSRCLEGKARVVRAMPDTPALIGYGVTGISYDEGVFSEEEINQINMIFSSVGTFLKVNEDQMNAVVCVSGSSPAYVYMFINELARSCAYLGLDEDTALKMAAGAVVGAGMMILSTGEDPEVLKERVCSKGGTTIEGVTKLEENGFREAIWAATEACFRRSRELSK